VPRTFCNIGIGSHLDGARIWPVSLRWINLGAGESEHRQSEAVVDRKAPPFPAGPFPGGDSAAWCISTVRRPVCPRLRMGPRSRPPVLRGTEYHDGASVAADAARAPGDRVVIEPPRNTRIRCPSRSSFSGGPANTVHSPRGLAR
jgi:hypothetical protein